MRRSISIVFAYAVLMLVTPSFADIHTPPQMVAAVPEVPDAGPVVDAEVLRDVLILSMRAVKANTLPFPDGDAFSLTEPPAVPDAGLVLASDVSRRIAASLDPNRFSDPNEGETQILIAQDLTWLMAETTGSLGR